ncbi:MAG: hypothetical protein IH614_05540 [Desulfuromonadales bacterium]|nr:hypothetical protein [Desulfuromonadales bacterium]
MAICTLCDKQDRKSHGTKPHEYLREQEERRIFGGAKKNGFTQQDYQCLQCRAKFTHSTDKNDFGWTLWQG